MQIKVLSYNIWFDTFLREQRLKSLIKKINSENPSIICLQEVVKSTLSNLTTEIETNYKYKFPKNITNRYGCVIFSKYPIEKTTSLNFKSNMGRQLDLVYVRLPNQKLLVITNTHFESEFEEHNELKISQYLYTSSVINKIFNDNLNNFNFLGIISCQDTNITKYDEIYYSKSMGQFNDAYNKQHVSKFTEEFTYDTRTNVLLSDSKREIRARLDRILYKSNLKNRESQLIQTSYKIIKGDLIEISDHYGVVATFNTA